MTLHSLTIIHDRACIIVGPDASDCTIEMCRVVTRTREGVAIEIVGPRASGVRIVNSNIYTSGGENPSIDPRSLKHNWKPWARAAVGIRIHGDATNGGAWIHHNTVASYTTALAFGDEASGPALPGIRLWKNRITANTTGLHLVGGDCIVEDNVFARNTGTAITMHGRGNRLLANRIMDNAGHGAVTDGTDVVNNVIAGNRGGALKLTGRGRILHNTFIANEGAILAIDDAEGSSQGPTQFANNLVDHDGPLFENDRPDGRHHNVYANHATAQPLGVGSRAGPVVFRDVARRDYRPAVDSVVVDVAVAIDGVTRDATASGRRIGAAPDAGAHEVGPEGAGGGERWIAPDGSDESGDGSEQKPFATITRATAGAGPDDVIYLKAGVYKTEGRITCAGAEGHPVRIVPAPGLPRAADRVRSFVPRKPLELAPAPGGTVVVEGVRWILTDAAHVVIEGIEFRDVPKGAVTMADRAARNVIRKCLFINCPTSYPGAKGWAVGIHGAGIEASDIVIEDCVFDRRPNQDYHHRETDVINPGQASWSKRWVFRRNRVAGFEKLQLGIGGMGRYPSGYHRIENNEFFECNRAVHIKTSDNIFRGNYIHDMVRGYLGQTIGMVNRSGYRNVYEGNRVEGCSYAGILVLSRDHIVRNNVFDECDTGVIIAHREFGAQPAENIAVHHNTVVNCARGVHVDPRCSAWVYNNIFYRSPDVFKNPAILPAVVADNSGIYPREQTSWALFTRNQYRIEAVLRADYNIYFNTEPMYARDYEGGHHDVVGDPLFVDPSARDYSLKAASPARGAGRSLDVGHDYLGRSRPLDGPDCGAFEH